MILCNCIIEAENNFLLESIAVCDLDSVGVDFGDVFHGQYGISKFILKV